MDTHCASDDTHRFFVRTIDDSIAVPDPEIVSVFVADAIFMTASGSPTRDSSSEVVLNGSHIIRMNLFGPPTAIGGDFIRCPAQELRHTGGAPSHICRNVHLIDQPVHRFCGQPKAFLTFPERQFDATPAENRFYLGQELTRLDRFG